MKAALLTICLMGLSLAATGQTVVQLEYFLDTDAGFGKNTLVAVTPAADGPFSFTVNVSGASVGYHILYMRTKDSNGQWSHTIMRNLDVFKNQTAGNVARAEYFFDTDPGVGRAISTTLTMRADGAFAFTIPKDKTTPGSHTLFVRAQDSPDGNWSRTQWKATTIVYCTPPDQPGAVASQTVCAGGSVTFTIPTVALATGYRWTASPGWTITGGQGTGTVTLKAPVVASATTFSALSVAAYNVCDTSQVRFFTALVSPLPAQPTIIVSGDTALVSSAASGNQWFLNGTAIGGATNPTYRPLTAGQFTIQVTQNGCASPLSDAYNRIVTGIDEPMFPGLKLFPNPFTDRITVLTGSAQPVRVLVYSMTGQLVSVTERVADGYQINAERLPAGCYIVRVVQDSSVMNRLLVK